MLTNKSNQICILNILREFSDEEHILQMKYIISKMNVVYGMTVDRRTVYSAVETLNLLGFDISTFEENGKGYFLRTREFEPSEIRLLIDSVYSQSFISSKQTTDLIGKLQKILSIHQRKNYKNLKTVKDNRKTANKEVLYSIEMLDEAITRKVKVEFDYYEYDLNKKLVPRRDRKYLINPYQMVCANGHYYLICNYDKYDNLSHYRIDLIKNIEILDESAKPLPNNFDAIAYSNSMIFKHGGESEPIEIICENFMTTEVIDKFGQDARLSNFDDKHFKLTISVPPLSIKHWALQYLPYCEVIKPKWLRDEIIQNLKQNKYNK